mmetsp:Transcript_43864/g.133578  ORF Transcript_43864/g.133578 Transcript_43864/m.133578 type:complete len:610 (-) Transcript_43864:307-2136(-)|eukprot:CAMPEP_0113563768 /NCGR_PEP_ID=MMETSP0015_2-20120614/21248_1 /TAXON_ID=2838 /ORGANISM="Odontella" /LENGTH=609 /DNA_ID=CAMNT_0000465777 /DNA_START=340 /DNA_END=2169 /DNA_ORIENTATION=+ /assembly_acc=CAM_ASM_000160
MPRKNKIAAPQGAAHGKSAASERRTEMKNDVKDTFPSKTYDVIEHCDQHDPSVASWDDTGTLFIIKDVPSLEQFYLPKKFDHSKFQSFVRQLNLYGFRNVSKEREGTASDDSAAVGSGHIVFKNENFKKGRKDLLVNIRRSKKGDRSQRKTKQEEELHSVCEALNQRFDHVDEEVKSMHAKMDVISARLDKVLNLLLAEQPRGGGNNGDVDDDRDDRHGRQRRNIKRRRFEDREEGWGDDDGGEHSVSASEASREGTPGYLSTASLGTAERESSANGSLLRNVSPACSDNLPNGALFPISAEYIRTTSTDRSPTISDELRSTATRVNGSDSNAVKFDRDLIAACETILEHSLDEDGDGCSISKPNEGVTPTISVKVGEHGPRIDRPEPIGQVEDISALDAMPLDLDGFDDIGDGGSSSLSGEDDILLTYDGEPLEQPPGVAPNLRVATVHDDGGNNDVLFRRGGGRKFLSHRTIMAGITLMSVIAAVAMGTILSVGKHSRENASDPRDTSMASPPDVSMGVYEEDVAAAAPCYDCAEVASSGSEEDEDRIVANEGAAIDVAAKEWSVPPARVVPTPLPTLAPSSWRRNMVAWNNVAPTSEPPTMRTIRF